MLWGSLGPSWTLENEVIVAGARAPPAATTISGATADPEPSGVEGATEEDFPGRTRSLYKDRTTPRLPIPSWTAQRGGSPMGSAPFACSSKTGIGRMPPGAGTSLRRVRDLAVVVGTAARARDVGLLRVTAARAVDQHRARRLPLGTAGPGVAPRHLPLRDGHFNPPGSPPRGRGRSLIWSPRALWRGMVCSGRSGPGAPWATGSRAHRSPGSSVIPRSASQRGSMPSPCP